MIKPVLQASNLGQRCLICAPRFLQHLGDAELLVLKVTYFIPQGAVADIQPSVELLKATRFARLRVDPDWPAAVLNVLLDHAFLPTAGRPGSR